MRAQRTFVVAELVPGMTAVGVAAMLASSLFVSWH